MKISHTLIAAAATIGLATSPAMAGGDKVRSEAVDISRYDLATEKGIDAAYEKIRGAAKRVCGAPGRPTLAEHVAMRKCMDKAIVTAIENMRTPYLKQAFAKRAEKSIG